jgi:hypothetical protein
MRGTLGDAAGQPPGCDPGAAVHGVAEQVENSHLYLFLGQLFAVDGRTNEAVTSYEKCLQLWNGPTEQREQIEADLARLHTHSAK